MLKILLTGITGLLGLALAQNWQRTFSLFGTASRQPGKDFPVPCPCMPFSLGEDDYGPLATFCTPDVIINCAAITDHAFCETNPEEAYRINAETPLKLARAFPRTYIIHVSTDAVFGHDAVFPDEACKPSPISIYGKTKLTGEELLLQEAPASLALRTTIVGLGGRRKQASLAEWIVASLKTRKPIGLYTDVIFTPISVWDFATILQWCIMHRPGGLLHATGVERVTKYDFGFALARECRLDTSLLNKALLADSPNQAVRLFDQSISSRKLQGLGVSLPGLKGCVTSIARRLK